MKNFYLKIKNNRILLGTKIKFSDVRNVFNIENQKIKDIDNILEIPEKKEEEVKNYLLKKIIPRILMKKEVIFQTLIKDKEIFLENGENKTNPHIVSLLDIIEFFGTDLEIRCFDNAIDKNYDVIANKSYKKLKMKYNKRKQEYNSDFNELDFFQNIQDFVKKIKNKQIEINRDFLLCKYYNFIKNNFKYKKDGEYIDFVPTIDLLERLKLNYKITNYKKEKENLPFLKEKIKRKGFLFDEEKFSILIPENFLKMEKYKYNENLKEISKKEIEENVDLKNKNINKSKPKFLVWNQEYKKLFLEILPNFIRESYKKMPRESYLNYELPKIKKINDSLFVNKNDLIIKEIKKVKEFVEEKQFEDLFLLEYSGGAMNLKYFDYVCFVIGKILYNNSLLKFEMTEETENPVKRFFQYKYYTNRHKFEKNFSTIFPFDFSIENEKKIDFEKINKLKNDPLTINEKIFLKVDNYEKKRSKLLLEMESTDIKTGTKKALYKTYDINNLEEINDDFKEYFFEKEISKKQLKGIDFFEKIKSSQKKKIASQLYMYFLEEKSKTEKEVDYSYTKNVNINEDSLNEEETTINQIEEFYKTKEKIFYEILEEKFVSEIYENQIKKDERIYYEVEIEKFNINLEKINIYEIMKSVIFKELIEKYRPNIVGEIKDGKLVKKKISINDVNIVKEIDKFKNEIVYSLFSDPDFKKIFFKNNKMLKILFRKNLREIILKKMRKDKKQKKETKEAKEYVEEASKDLKNVEKEEEEKENEFIRSIIETLQNNTQNFLSKNKNYSLNFKLKNLKKQLKNEIEIKKENPAIFLEDIYNEVNLYNKFFFKKEKSELFVKISDKNYYKISKEFEEEKEKFNASLIPINKEILFIKIYLKMIKNFNYVIPFVRNYVRQEGKFVSIMFFDEIIDAVEIINGIVLSPSNLNILQSKYKFFRNHPEIKQKVLFVDEKGEKRMKEMNYEEYLELKYTQKSKVHNVNPFNITEKTKLFYMNKKNSLKYHRIFNENIKYLFTNITTDNEIIIVSNLFKEYENLVMQILILDKILKMCYNILSLKNKEDVKVDIRNYDFETQSFDFYLNEKFVKRLSLYLQIEEIEEKTYSLDNIFYKIEKLLKNI